MTGPLKHEILGTFKLEYGYKIEYEYAFSSLVRVL